MADVISGLKKCKILNLDEKTKPIEAYFNPKEVSLDKAVPWNAHKASKADHHILEFTNAQPRVLSVELFFDGYEQGVDVWSAYVQHLLALTEVKKNANSDSEKRPPMCELVWGSFPRFKGVIESVQTKFTMFLPNGTPVRATCSVKIKQADELRLGSRKS